MNSAIVDVLRHHAQRFLSLTSNIDPAFTETILLQDTVRLAGKRLSPIFQKDPEYKNGILYPRLTTKQDIERFYQVRLVELQAVRENRAKILPDSSTATDTECSLCGNFTDYHGSLGCRIERIQQRQKAPISFAPDEDY